MDGSPAVIRAPCPFGRVSLCVALALLTPACERLPSLPGAKRQAPAAVPAEPPALQEGKALLDKGQLDAALERLSELPDDPVSLYYQGLAHLRKGLATPLPDAGFRDEDVLGVQALERAVAAKPEFAAAHFTLGELLAPYARRRRGPSTSGRKRAPAGSPAPEEPDASPERVTREYQAALSGDKTSHAPIDALIRFAREMKRPQDAEPAYLEWLTRDKESAEPHVAYGDYLYGERKEALPAIEQYKLALVWKPQAPLPKQRICDIYLDMAQEHYAKNEWATSEARLMDAQKFLTEEGTPRAKRAQDLQARLKAIRH